MEVINPCKREFLVIFDLDGQISVIDVYNTVKDKSSFRYMLTGYDKLEAKLLKFVTMEKYDTVYITDLNITEEQLQILKHLGKNTRIIYCDHHIYPYDLPAALQKLGLNITLIHSTEFSAGANLYMWMSKNHMWYKGSCDLRRLVKISDTYDMWKKTSDIFIEEAMPLNDLFWSYGPEKFMKKFKNGYALDTEDLELMTKMNEERQTYLKDAFENHSIINPHGKLLMIMKPDSKYINDFTIFYPEYIFYLMFKDVGKDTFTYSVRINSSDEKLTIHNLYGNIVKRMGEEFKRGGHEKAGGVVIPANLNTKFLESFNAACEEMIEEYD